MRFYGRVVVQSQADRFLRVTSGAHSSKGPGRCTVSEALEGVVSGALNSRLP